MNKKFLGRITAASLAAMSAVSAISVTASADLEKNSSGYVTGNVYKVTITATTTGIGAVTSTSTTTTYYSTESDAIAAVNAANANAGTAASYSTVSVSTAFPGSTIYIDSNNVITTSKPVSGTYGTYNTYGSYYNNGTYYTNGYYDSNGVWHSYYYNGYYDSNGVWHYYNGTSAAYVAYPYANAENRVYLGSDGRYYPNYSSLVAAGTTVLNSYVISSNTYDDVYKSVSSYGGTVYFETSGDGGYYTSSPTSTTVVISGKSSSYDTGYYNSYYDYDDYDVYKVGSYYYPTKSSALSAAGNDYSRLTKVYDYSKPQTNYFSQVTGQYYTTYDAALSASNNVSSNVYTFSYYSNDYYYYNGSYYYYGDPYYYYFLNKNQSSSSSSSSNDTTTAAVGNRKGWTSVTSYLKNLKSGSSVSVSMNEETSVPSSVMSAIKGRDITVQFVLSNGVTYTVNGKDITAAKEMSIDTAYNTSNVPTKLVQAAYKKNKAVSTAQISVDDDSFGAKVDITVKFATKRAGCTAKLYRYNASKGTLSLVDSSTVQSTGKCTFDGVAKGGDFVVVLC